MSTPYTLMRCRMKDLISCFNACKLPIEKHGDESDHQKPKPPSINNERNREREKTVKAETTSERVPGGEESPASWKSCESEEEDYIVFYFKDDEAGGDVIEEFDAGCCHRRKKETHQESTCRVRVDAKLNESELEEHMHTLSESSESSTGSFAFPTIQREWIGSPVLMPRPDGRQNMSCGVCIQCCKF